MLFFFSWGEKAEVTVAVRPFLITGEVWIVQAHRFCEIHLCKYNLLYFHLKFNKRYKFLSQTQVLVKN